MRGTVEIKWFKECSTIEQARALYLKLVMQHHPDKGGDLRTMQEINAEWDCVKSDPSRLATHSRSGSSYARAQDKRKATGSRAYNWSEYTTKDEPLTPGRYTVKITSVVDNEDKYYVALIFDVLEVKHSKCFVGMQWYKHCIYLKYEHDWQRRNTARIVEVISKSNKGFDGLKCLQDGDAYGFVGKVVGVVLSQQFIDGDGFINCEDVFAV